MLLRPDGAPPLRTLTKLPMSTTARWVLVAVVHSRAMVLVSSGRFSALDGHCLGLAVRFLHIRIRFPCVWHLKKVVWFGWTTWVFSVSFSKNVGCLGIWGLLSDLHVIIIVVGYILFVRVFFCHPVCRFVYGQRFEKVSKRLPWA